MTTAPKCIYGDGRPHDWRLINEDWTQPEDIPGVETQGTHATRWYCTRCRLIETLYQPVLRQVA